MTDEDRYRQTVRHSWIWVIPEHPVLRKLDIAFLVIQLLLAFAVGLFVVARWLVHLWQSQSWWHFAILSAVSLFLLFGFAPEVYARRLGPYGFVILLVAVAAGGVHLLSVQV